jgi:hypothetical protein
VLLELPRLSLSIGELLVEYLCGFCALGTAHSQALQGGKVFPSMESRKSSHQVRMCFADGIKGLKWPGMQSDDYNSIVASLTLN